MDRANKPTDVFMYVGMGPKDTCWPWRGKVNAKDGRPYFTIAGVRRPAYVVVLEAFTGENASGRVARHSCDNPTCCNPYHLAWGTSQDNSNDMMERERHGIPKTVLRAIKKLLAEGRSHTQIADLYGLSRETITAINTGRSHKNKD